MIKKILVCTSLVGAGALATLIAMRGSARVPALHAATRGANAGSQEPAHVATDPAEPVSPNAAGTPVQAAPQREQIRNPPRAPAAGDTLAAAAPQTLEEQKAEQEAAVALVESHFVRSARDAEGIRVERELRVSLQSANITGATVKDIGCVQTMCKLTLSTEGADSQRAAAEAMARLSALPTEKLFEYADDGRSIVVYAARDGQSLPRASQQ
jgi:hypothetical protein